MFIRPVESSDVEPLLNMLKISGQFDDERLLHVRETLKNYLSGNSQELCLARNRRVSRELHIVPQK